MSYVTLGLTFLSLMHINGRIMVSIFKNLSMNLRDTLERTPKVISI